MFPGNIDPKMMAAAMKRMGIKTQQIDAEEVVIKTADGKRLVVKNPNVTKMQMPGSPAMLQVSGDIIEDSGTSEREAGVPEEDVSMVAEQAGVSKEQARKALEDAGGDIAEAIMKLRKN